MNKPLLMDGAWGTCLWDAAEKKGIKKTPTWMYNVNAPELVAELAMAYTAAGSEILLSNTFTATRIETEREGFDLKEVITGGIKLLRDNSDAKVAYSVGPLAKMMEPYGELKVQAVRDIYRDALEIATHAEPDYILLETFFDLNMLEVVANEAKEMGLPFICSMSFTETGKTYLGDSAEAMVQRLSSLKPAALGMNCSVGPEHAAKLIAEFAGLTDIPLLVKPNASSGSLSYTPREFAAALLPAFEAVSFAGACCGSSPAYIRELKALLENR